MLNADTGTMRIGFVGAGNINFGGPGVPWDHASRLEKIGGVQFVGIADVDAERAKAVLSSRQAGSHGHLYQHCKVRIKCGAKRSCRSPDHSNYNLQSLSTARCMRFPILCIYNALSTARFMPPSFLCI